jgi:uncharacterized membrane protein
MANTQRIAMPNTSQRILPIDAARGAVMLFSCLAHFAWWIHPAYPDASALLSGVGMVATPTFLLISGAMVGMLCAVPRPDRDLKSQLFNRGLFLLTVGHLLIASAEAHSNGGFSHTLRGITVVDEIGLATLVAAFYLPQLARFDNCVRLAQLAALVLALGAVINWIWLGLQFPTQAPVVRHLAIYALGLPLGHYLADFARGKVAAAAVAVRLLSMGALLALSAFALRGLRWFFDHDLAVQSVALDLTFKITEKSPPSPAYLLFFGGCALLLLGVTFSGVLPGRPRGEHAVTQAILHWLAVIGRASLFVFVLQYFLYWTLPDLLGIQPGRHAVLLFAGNVLLIRLAAGFWTRWRGNRWLTLGIKLPGSGIGSRA